MWPINTDISRYLSFIIALFFAFGFAFEVPIAILLLVASGFATSESLGRKRPYFIVAAFVIGMLLTPPDVISQTLLALPMWLLFEIGLLLARRLPKKGLIGHCERGVGRGNASEELPVLR